MADKIILYHAEDYTVWVGFVRDIPTVSMSGHGLPAVPIPYVPTPASTLDATFMSVVDAIAPAYRAALDAGTMEAETFSRRAGGNVPIGEVLDRARTEYTQWKTRREARYMEATTFWPHVGKAVNP